MIRISKKGDYAVYIMACLAKRRATASENKAVASNRTGAVEGTPLSAQDIAVATRLSKPMVANLLKDLTRAGLLESIRGQSGGYRIALPLAEISLAQILAAVEGPLQLVSCVADGVLHLADRSTTDLGNFALLTNPHGDHECSYSGLCPSKSPMRQVHQRIARMLQEVKLPELCGDEVLTHAFAPAPTTLPHSQAQPRPTGLP